MAHLADGLIDVGTDQESAVHPTPQQDQSGTDDPEKGPKMNRNSRWTVCQLV